MVVQELCENAPDAQLAAHTAAAGLASCERLAASAEAVQDGELREARRRGCRRVLLALSKLAVNSPFTTIFHFALSHVHNRL